MKSYVWKTLWLCGLYAITSIASSLTLKFLFSVFKFQDTILILFYESTFNIGAGFLILQLFDIDMPGASQTKQNGTILYSLTYVAQVFCGMKALSLVSIPMFNTLRRTLIFFVFVMTQCSSKSTSTVSSVFSVSVMLITGGALVAGYDHFEEEYMGYSLVLLTNILTALTLHLTNAMTIHPLQLLFRNSLNMWPLLLIAVLVSEEVYVLLARELHPEFFVCLTLLSAFGFLNTFVMNRCAMEISPIAIAITHNVKDIFSTLISMFLFDDLKLDMLLIAGFSISFAGSMLYTYSKFSEIKAANVLKREEYQPVATSS